MATFAPSSKADLRRAPANTTSVNLTGCDNITDDELIALVMACPDLKYIDLE
jgi:hypothetical protein